MTDDPFDGIEPETLPNVTRLDEFRNRPRPTGKAAPSPKRASRFFSAATLEGKPVPPRQWLVDDLVPARNVTLLYGDGGVGKSLVALQLAAAVALGRPWLGRPTVSGHAIFMSAEDDADELHRRLQDITQAEGVTLADLDRLTIRSLAGEDALLAILDPRSGVLHPSDLYRELDAYLEAEQPAVAVLDTLADLFPGNEIIRAQARQFIGMMRALAIRHDCTVVLLAHPSLSGLQSGSGTSGSTAWNNSVRSRLYLERVMRDDREDNPDARVLTNKKQNYGRTGDEIALTWRDGVFVADAPEPGLDRTARRSKAMRKFMELLRKLDQEGRDVNARSGPNYAPSVFADHPDAEGITKVAFREAMNLLFSEGAIRNAQIKRDGKLATVIQEAE
uniref:RecA-family ATPase-like protein n=1 Tax=Cereibacter sphaeroides (strain ATCC 17025 / ATH 2.4.3) TaxID=349102 RepID=A4WNS4_CERS5